MSISEDGADIVHHRKHKSTEKKKRRTVSAGDEFKNNEIDDLTISVEMEDDNFIPEVNCCYMLILFKKYLRVINAIKKMVQFILFAYKYLINNQNG